MNKDQQMLDILKKSDGQETIIDLVSGKTISVWNIAWGYDSECEFAHITANVSPRINNANAHFFYSNEIAKIQSS